ncbi:bifunctional DNA primase/polymerase [Nonomuraea recticatena]|uniref:DNA primase/polymerase bifunctional N-terminal domain-containing protein n=1 Tax=Nonomuraea recticatena TaxID=46178 RepID=A0ABN3T8U8_9ACTN
MATTISGLAPLTIARWCAGNGWPIHPLASGAKTPARNCRTCQEAVHDPRECLCIRQGRWCHGFHAATTDTARIQRWWRRNPRFGVGVACGTPSGLLVIDIDTHADLLPTPGLILPGLIPPAHVDPVDVATGFDALHLLAQHRNADSPAHDTSTVRVRTPSGGLHVWYRLGSDDRFACSTGSCSSRALAWQVDVRADGGYIIAPGVTTRAGPYTLLGRTRQPAPLPGWLRHDLIRTGHRPSDSPPPVPLRQRQLRTEVSAAAGMLALSTLLDDVAGCAAASCGTGFADKLNRAAYTAGGLVAADRLCQDEAEQALSEAATRAPAAEPTDREHHPLRHGRRPSPPASSRPPRLGRHQRTSSLPLPAALPAPQTRCRPSSLQRLTGNRTPHAWRKACPPPRRPPPADPPHGHHAGAPHRRRHITSGAP